MGGPRRPGGAARAAAGSAHAHWPVAGTAAPRRRLLLGALPLVEAPGPELGPSVPVLQVGQSPREGGRAVRVPRVGQHPRRAPAAPPRRGDRSGARPLQRRLSGLCRAAAVLSPRCPTPSTQRPAVSPVGLFAAGHRHAHRSWPPQVFPGAGLGSRCLCGRDSRVAQKGDDTRSPFTGIREPEETGSQRPVLVPMPDVSPRPSQSLWRDPKAEGRAGSRGWHVCCRLAPGEGDRAGASRDEGGVIVLWPCLWNR